MALRWVSYRGFSWRPAAAAVIFVTGGAAAQPASAIVSLAPAFVDTEVNVPCAFA
jgi:hypothetical protein